MNLHYYLSFLLLTAIVTFAEEPSVPDNVKMDNTNVTSEGERSNATSTEKAIPTTSAPIFPPEPTSNVTTVGPPTTTNVTTTARPTTPPPTTPTTPIPTSTITPTTPSTNTTTVPTTPAPTTPAPPKPIDEWIVKDKSGNVCIIANMLIKITVPYESTNKTVNAEFNLNNVGNATASGDCGQDVQTLMLTWGNITSTFTFGHNKEKSSYFLTNIDVNITVNNHTFPNNTMVNVSKISFKKVDDTKLFTVPMNHSYTCANEKPISLNGTVFNATSPLNKTVLGTISVSKVHVEAFGFGNNTKYSAPMDCAAVETPDIVPIVVGLVLAGLVVVVLIAYLVGRRRAQSQGYLSM